MLYKQYITYRLIISVIFVRTFVVNCTKMDKQRPGSRRNYVSSDEERLRPSSARDQTFINPNNSNLKPTLLTRYTGLENLHRAEHGPHLRRVKDDRYYMSLIHQHTEKISKEYKRLKTEISELNKVASIKDELETKLKKMEQTKLDLEQQEQKWRFISNKLKGDNNKANIESEIIEKQNDNKDLMIRLEDIYIDRNHKEHLLEDLKNSIRQESERNEIELANLPLAEQKKYHKLLAEVNDLDKQIEKKETVLKDQTNKNNFYKNRIDNIAKQTQLALMHKYESLVEKKDSLLNAGRDHPEKDEAKLLEHIREARNKSTEMEEELKRLQKSIESCQEIIEGLDQDLEEGYSARHGKYLELTKREQKMTQYLETAEDRLRQYEEMLKNTGMAICDAVQVWGLQIDVNPEISGGNGSKDTENAKIEYDLLVARLKNVNNRITKTKNEIEELKKKSTQFQNEFINMKDPADAREAFITNHQELLDEKEIIIKKIKATISAIEVAQKKDQDLSEQLLHDKLYGEIKSTEERIGENENKIVNNKKIITTLKESANIDDRVKETLEMIKIYNEILINKKHI